MPTNTNTGYLLNPTTVIAPDLAVQQQQVQRQQDLIDALRGQSLQSIDAGKGVMSWTQSAAKIGEALAARVMQKRNDQKSIAMSQAMAARLGPMFGLSSGMPQAGAAPTALATALSQRGGDPASTAGPIQVNPTAVGGSPVPPSAPLSTPVSPPVETPQPADPAPAQPGGSYPMSLSGNPQTDFTNYVMNPDKFTEARIAASAPTDFTKLLQQSGIDPHSPLGQQIMQSQIAKQNYIAPINGRPGSTIRDPNDPSRVLGYDAPNIEGAFPVYGADGMPTGYRQAPGAAGAIGAVEGSKAGAKASATAPYELVTLADANGNQYQVPKSTLTGGGGTPAPASPAPGVPHPSGSLGAFYGSGASAGAPPGGARSGMGPGEVEAAKISAKNFSDTVGAGSNAQQANFQLDRIGQIASGLPTGAGSGIISNAKSAYNAVSDGVAGGHLGHLDADNIAKFDEMKKISSSLAQSLSQGAGMNGTDARLQSAIDSLPNSNYSPKAIQGVVGMLKGLQTASLARGNAAAAWQQAHGANTFPAFQREWQANYDPVLFEHYAQGPQVFSKWAQTLKPEERQAALSKYRGLKAMGAF